MNILTDLILGDNGILNRAFYLYGIPSKLHYLQNVKYPAEMEVEMQIVRTVSIRFIMNPDNNINKKETDNHGLLYRHGNMSGYINSHELDQIPVANQALLAFSKRVWKIVHVEEQNIQGENTIIYINAVE